MTRAVYFHSLGFNLCASAQFLLSYWPKDLDEYNLIEHTLGHLRDWTERSLCPIFVLVYAVGFIYGITDVVSIAPLSGAACMLLRPHRFVQNSRSKLLVAPYCRKRRSKREDER